MKKLILLLVIIAFSVNLSKAQAVYIPYSYQLDQKFNSSVYSTNSSIHTSLKPFLLDSTLRPTYNAIMNRGVDTNRKAWAWRKLFNEHLFDVKTKEYTFYGDYLTDFGYGRDFSDKITTNINTRGFQFGGTVGDKFFFYTSGFENSGKFAGYYKDVVTRYGFVPGQAYDRNYNGKTPGLTDWSYVTAIMSYSPIKQLNITLGTDKTFIGDGYRSLLLSDYSANYPLLRLTANVGKVQYMMMWAYLEDMQLPKFDTFGSNRRKWAAFHYLDWNVTNKLSLGFFNALIAQEADDNGKFHGFDANYINPVFFASSLGPSSQPDNVLVGFTGKYKIFDKTAVYAQLLLDNIKTGDAFSGSLSDNANGFQVGIRGADLFKVEGFNYLFEYNTVKPYTYSSPQAITSYTDYSQPLADPIGANFREFIGILNYTYGRFDFMGQVNYAKYGLNSAIMNYGKDVALPTPSNTTTNIGQGITTSLYYTEGTVSYLINPKYNMRFELGGLVRNEKNDLGTRKTTQITFGIRSTFRSMYHDF
ncbi:capsule assembly Wzi family protein [Mucilaginibacter sp. BJC16-A38]|uniref:capsule assembly Wzi family protein n=1 Tax=Mucilaginibacter phenanthrenivorans TaxID=1234842 RepID=UPI0021584012|nr:capsule assembly Wzi family protein [Mucilaginibacter phenanthrenivorans]MCR8558293.1 capsule assembly Wzi family protein [Mucilaginibacter phenanthrenivorans]